MSNKKNEESNLKVKRKIGLVRPCVAVLIVVSVAGLIFSFTPCANKVQAQIVLHMGPEFEIDSNLLTDIFILLWGITQALILFYMEHKKDKVLGVQFERIIQVSVGRWLVRATLFMLFSEMILWILAVCKNNVFLIETDLVLQLVNVAAVFIVIQAKQRPKSVIGTCRKEIIDKHDNYVKTNGATDISQMLLFEMLKEDDRSTTNMINETKRLVALAYASDDKTERSRASDDKTERSLEFKYLLDITERICSSCVNRKEEITGNYNSIPEVLKYYFEIAEAKDMLAVKAILFNLVRSRNIYDTDEVLNMLRLTRKHQGQLYAWCGIWSIYWLNRSAEFMRELDVAKYCNNSEGATISYEDIMFMDGLEDGFFMEQACNEWRDRFVARSY